MTYSLHQGIKNNQPQVSVIKKRGTKVLWRKDFIGENYYDAKDKANTYIQQCIEDDNWNASNRD